MKKALRQLWDTFMSSVKELDEPIHRAVLIIAFIIIIAIIIGCFIGGIFNFIETIVETLCNTINTCVIGEFPEIPVE